jgi:hypothetical protein
VNVKQIITLAATYLQLEDVLNMSLLGGGVLTPTEQTEKNFNLLLRAVNLVQDELACDYIALKHSETVVVNDERILFDTLQKRLLQVYFIKNEVGEAVSYRLYPNYIKIENGTYLLEYSYLPDEVAVEGQLELFSNKISERMLAYAVASEYALINGLFDEATTWKKRFEDAMRVATNKKSAVTLPTRRWL